MFVKIKKGLKDNFYVMKIKFNKLDQRAFVQGFFVVLSLYLWYRFYLFVRHFDSGGAFPYVPRPNGIDAFMPVGALVALKHLVVSGVFDTVHPAALVVFLAVLAVSLLFRRGFCGWICPVGAVSDALGKLGKAIFGRNVNLPPVFDTSLRAVKYLILLFFLKLVLIDMPPQAVAAFLQSPYYKVVDAKLLDFWIHPSSGTVAFVLAMVLLSVMFRGFWCRYLCPYGALLGILALLSPSGIKRDPELCNSCGLCTRACPSRIKVHEKRRVVTPECTACFSCHEGCPRGALSMSIAGTSVSKSTFAALLLLTFFAFVAAAKATGHWESAVTYREYAHYLLLRAMITH